MTNEQIKQLEAELWNAADALRANSKLTAAEYKDPIGQYFNYLQLIEA